MNYIFSFINKQADSRLINIKWPILKTFVEKEIK